MSLISEIDKKSKSSKIKKSFLVIFIIVLIYIWYNYIFPKELNLSSNKEIKIATVKNWDLKTFIEADWRVVLKNEYSLNFVWDWIIKEIYKQPWDYIQNWDKIAILDSKYLDIDISKAQIAVDVAKTNYEIKKRWISDLELDVSKKQLEKDIITLEVSQKEIDTQINSLINDIEIAKRDLETLKKEQEIDILQSNNNLEILKIEYENIYSSSENTIKQEQEKYKSLASQLVMETGQMITSLEKNLYNIDVLLGITVANRYQNDSFELLLWAKDNSLKNIAEKSFIWTKESFEVFYKSWENYRKTIDFQNLDNYSEIEKRVLDFSLINKELNKTLSYTVDVLKNSISSVNLSQESIDNYINNFESTLSQSKKDSSDYMKLYQDLQELKILIESKVLSQKKDLETTNWKITIANSSLEKVILQNSLDLEKATQKIQDLGFDLEELNDKKENTLLLSQAQSNISKASLDSKKYNDESELQPFYMAILQAEENLKEVKKKKDDSILISPIKWKIVSINGQAWESTNSLKDAFVNIIDDKIFLAEIYVEEFDVIKVKKDQKVYINFDAIDWITLTWEVIYVDDKATIDTNEMVSYKVQVSFISNDERIKDGLSTTVQLITKEVNDVLIIPVASVKSYSWKPWVMMEDWTIRKVITWFTDWKNVEVISWLKSWEKVKY